MILYATPTYDLDKLPLVLAEALAILREHDSEFDFIVVRGISGLVVGAPVSLSLEKPLVVIRKGGENTHSKVHPNLMKVNGKRGLFLDDLIASGTTLRECARVVRQGHGTITCQYLYMDGMDRFGPCLARE